ncbi:putative rRNA maturation factor [Parelusimicrobium proximum]|uniref:rRNA maturation RNase YbeY n=1 Tax=Parelusimicrobium proximum TaxID=3228953 RepID=UPI003D16457C
MKINVFYKTRVADNLRKTGLFKKCAEISLGKYSSLNGEVNIIFVSEKEILKINTEYLGHNYITDVISFNYPFDKKLGGSFGDVFICYKVAQKNAPIFGHSALEEMLMYVSHGCLHLAGMDDSTQKLRAAMDKKSLKIIEGLLSKK